MRILRTEQGLQKTDCQKAANGSHGRVRLAPLAAYRLGRLRQAAEAMTDAATRLNRSDAERVALLVDVWCEKEESTEGERCEALRDLVDNPETRLALNATPLGGLVRRLALAACLPHFSSESSDLFPLPEDAGLESGSRAREQATPAGAALTVDMAFRSMRPQPWLASGARPQLNGTAWLRTILDSSEFLIWRRVWDDVDARAESRLDLPPQEVQAAQ